MKFVRAAVVAFIAASTCWADTLSTHLIPALALLLAHHAREHVCLGKLVQGTVCKILNEEEVKPHQVHYYLERRDPEFKEKMAEVLFFFKLARSVLRHNRVTGAEILSNNLLDHRVVLRIDRSRARVAFRSAIASAV